MSSLRALECKLAGRYGPVSDEDRALIKNALKFESTGNLSWRFYSLQRKQSRNNFENVVYDCVRDIVYNDRRQDMEPPGCILG